MLSACWEGGGKHGGGLYIKVELPGWPSYEETYLDV